MNQSIEDAFIGAARQMSSRSGEGATVAVVIPTYNHARFLGEAIASVLAQVRKAAEIIVVDDGSTDDPAAVVAGFPGVRLIRQENQGRAAACNTGLRSAVSTYVVFLDADDRLLPNALAAGLRCAVIHPACAFVYGGHRDIAEDGVVVATHHCDSIRGDPYAALLRRNMIRMQAAVLFRRDRLIEVDGFDETLRRAEDYDLFLRLARRYPVGCHASVVAEYRWHGQNMSGDPVKMLAATLEVLDRHEAQIDRDAPERPAIAHGRQIWRDHYTWVMLEQAYLQWPSRRAVRLLRKAVTESPRTLVRSLNDYVHRRIKRPVPSAASGPAGRRRG